MTIKSTHTWPKWHTLVLACLSRLWPLLVPLPVVAQATSVTVVRVAARPAVPEVQCALAPRSPAALSAAEADPREIPDEDDVQAALSAFGVSAQGESNPIQRNSGVLGQAANGEPYRVAIWGDSHLAAGFFTQELVKILKLTSDQVRSGFVPANMGRPGVRSPLRKSCVSPHWRYESAHASAAAAAAPGPGLVNAVASEPGAAMVWDLRNAAGIAESRQVRVLLQQTPMPLQLAISVDGAPEVDVVMSGGPGPAILELSGDGPLSVVRIRLVAGEIRLHGLALPGFPATALQMDVFGYPGATVAGWKLASPDYLSAWFAQTPYNLVMMEYGTNEGNAKPFDAQSYQQTLRQSVRQMRSVFPDAACVLIAPGDRGVLVRRSENRRQSSTVVRQIAGKNGVRWTAKATGKATARSATGSSKSRTTAKSGAHPAKTRVAQRSSAPQRRVTQAPQVDAMSTATQEVAQSGHLAKNLLQYTLIHEQIGRIQLAVAQEHGCRVWSMLKAMGGQGGAYRWVRQSPPLMARDLIHFTVSGYQQLANQFANDMDWESSQLMPGLKP